MDRTFGNAALRLAGSAPALNFEMQAGRGAALPVVAMPLCSLKWFITSVNFGAGGMNWRCGFFRLWLSFTFAWVAVTGWLLASDVRVALACLRDCALTAGLGATTSPRCDQGPASHSANHRPARDPTDVRDRDPVGAPRLQDFPAETRDVIT